MFKIITFVPAKNAQKIRQAMGDAGAGVLGNYHHASFSTKGIGRFTPSKGAHPTIGKAGEPQEVEEERIEMICEQDKAKEVIVAMRKVHPYEEVAFDIYPLINEEEL